jgi:sulfate permease, SulP family
MHRTFIPKLFTVYKKGYSRDQFSKDMISGLIVGIVALPLAIAFAIASGVSPEKGLITAILAGFIISAFGGSRTQIGGPTGAFIIIVYGIVAEFGINGLTIATFMAGIMIMIMGFAKLGSLIKFVPYPLVVGFTSGIALTILASQVKDFLGLDMGVVPAGFIEKIIAFSKNFGTINFYSAGIAVFTVFVSMNFNRISKKIPGSLIAILLTTVAVQFLNLPVETIETRFGEINASFSKPGLPHIDFETIKLLLQPAFTIALLGAIESLLSAVVSDGMTGSTHRSNIELVSQGAANIVSSIFGGIPATGAIARTATNVRNGGRTPLAGIVHAVTLLAIMFFAGKWAKLIPLSCLAGVLVVVAYNMSEWKSFLTVSKGPRPDVVVLLTTFFLTVLVDLTIAIQIGMVLSVFLFMSRMAKISKVNLIGNEDIEEEDDADPNSTQKQIIPKGVRIYEITGPFFFGIAHKFKDTLKDINENPKILILRMRNVPTIDATGLHNLREIIHRLQSSGTKVILSGVQRDVYKELDNAKIVSLVGNENITEDIKGAMVLVNNNEGKP